MRHKKLYSGLFFALFFLAYPVHAVELDLPQAIRLACDSTLDAFRFRDLFLAQYWEYRNYKARRLPNLTLDLTPMQYNRDIVKRYISETDMDVYRTQQSLYSYGNLSLTQNLDLTGGTFYVNSELGFFRSFGQTVYSQFSSVPLRVGYSQDLLGYNPFKWEKRIEPVKYNRARKELIYNMEEIAVTAVSYFFELALAELGQKQAGIHKDLCQRLYDEGQERWKQHALSATDLMDLELALTSAENELLTSRNTKEKQESALSSFLNLPKGEEVHARLPDDVPVELIPEEEAMYYLRQNHPVYVAQQQNILEARQEADKAKKERFIEADIDISVGFNQVADEISQAYHHPLQQNMVSVGVTVPLVDWGVRRGKYRIAQSNLNVAENEARKEKQKIEEELAAMVRDYNVQVQIARTSKRSVELAEKVLEEIVERFRLGKDDINSLFDCMLRKDEAGMNYVRALYSCWLTFYRIRQMTAYDFQQGCPMEIHSTFEIQKK